MLLQLRNENEMVRFKFNKTQSQTNAPRVVMALEMSDNGNVSTLKYVVPRLSRTKSVCSSI